MPKTLDKKSQDNTVILNYSHFDKRLLFTATLLSILTLFSGYYSGWDSASAITFVALLVSGLVIGVADILALKLLNPRLMPLPNKYSLFTAFVFLMLTTAVIYYGISILMEENLSLPGIVQLNQFSPFQITLVAGISYVVLLAFFFQQAKHKALMKSSQADKLQALQSRIRPHFIFNSMNSIAGLIRHNPEMAEQALQDLADLIRVLMADARKLVPLTAEIETSKQYLKIEKLRLGDRLTVQWHLSKIPKNCFVPSLILQPLLENAVYHGIEPSFGGGIIDIDMRADQEKVQILIRNPLPDDGERSHRKGNQIAMDNIKQRLSRHFGDRSSLSSSRRNEIHITKITFPIITNRQAV